MGWDAIIDPTHWLLLGLLTHPWAGADADTSRVWEPCGKMLAERDFFVFGLVR